MGRPKKEIDYDMVEKLANIHCTQEEIASMLGMSSRTLQRDATFCRIYKIGLDKARMSLRRMQWKAAESGDKTMLVWLGKIYLKQIERTAADTTVKVENDPVNELIKSIDKLKK